MRKVVVIGEGAWGTAIATLLATNGFKVKLWCFHKEIAKQIKNNRFNERYFPHIKLDNNIEPSTDYDILQNSDWIFEAIPVQFLRSVLKKFIPCYSPEQNWVILSKGMEKDSLLFPFQILDDVFNNKVNKVVLAGPSFAKELAQKNLTAVMLASNNYNLATKLQKDLTNNYFRTYLSKDIIGIQASSAFKNVIALGIGILEGANYQCNTRAYFLTLALQEIGKLIRGVGGESKSLYGLAGVGDLVLTATMGGMSRNLKVGRLLGQGKKIDAILKRTGYIPEGLNTVQALWQLHKDTNLKLPILNAIYTVIFKNAKADYILQALIATE